MFQELLTFDRLKKLAQALVDLRDERKRQLSQIEDEFPGSRFLRKFYVEPDCQLQNPADDGIDKSPVSKVPIFRFLNRFLNEERSAREFGDHLFVLADAGMGKSSLLVILKLMHVGQFFPSGYDCVLLKLGSATLDSVRSIPNKGSCLLLLDALDEDTQCIGRPDERLIDILEATEGFWKVVITCRTAFMKLEVDNIYGNAGKLRLHGYLVKCAYLSLFSSDQISRYLTGLYGERGEKRELAEKLVCKMDTLAMRPLLLAHMDDLLEAEQRRESWNESQVFRILCMEWLSREKKKLRKLGHVVHAQELFEALSYLALWMEQSPSRTVLSEDQLMKAIQFHPILDSLKNFDFGGRSLLNRNSAGQYRFSHYSIQEFLCIQAVLQGFKVGSKRLKVTGLMQLFLALGLRDSPRLRYLDFQGRHFYKLLLSGSECEGCNFSEIIFRKDFTSAIFTDCIFNDCNFAQSDFNSSDWSGCSLINSKFSGNFWGVSKWKNCDLSGAHFSNEKLSGASFVDCIFFGAELSGANIAGCEFIRCRFSPATIQGINFEKATVVDCDIIQ